MKGKTSYLIWVILVIVTLAFYVSGQVSTDGEKQKQQDKPDAFDKLEPRVWKLEMKISDLERRLILLENKTNP